MATRGRPKRTRKKGAGRAVHVKPHGRSPRGSDRGKPRVKVDGYRRGRPKASRKRKGRRKR